MEYTLITANGRVMQFYLRGVAEVYKNIHGGVILTGEILNTSAAVVAPPAVPPSTSVNERAV